MRDFMAAKMPKIHVRDCSVYYKRIKESKSSEPTNTGYVEFASSAVRDYVNSLIDDDKDNLQVQDQGQAGGHLQGSHKERHRQEQGAHAGL